MEENHKPIGAMGAEEEDVVGSHKRKAKTIWANQSTSIMTIGLEFGVEAEQNRLMRCIRFSRYYSISRRIGRLGGHQISTRADGAGTSEGRLGRKKQACATCGIQSRRESAGMDVGGGERHIGRREIRQE